MRFVCETCKKTFDAEGTKQEWMDRTYGACSRWVAVCPDCSAECQTARTVKLQADGLDSADPDGGSCSCGGGCSNCGGGSCSCGA